jgi:hypothetical protein
LVVPPGVRVTVHVPVEGNPLRFTLPVARVQVGCVIKPIIGARGTGTLLIVLELVAGEVHPPALVTVQVYVPGGIPERVYAPPDQLALAPAGVLVRVHVPLVGRPVKSILPDGIAQVGCVIVPITGVVAGPAELLIVTGFESSEVQPEELVTV